MSEAQSNQKQLNRYPSEKPDLIVIAGPTSYGKTNGIMELCRQVTQLPPQLAPVAKVLI